MNTGVASGSIPVESLFPEPSAWCKGWLQARIGVQASRTVGVPGRSACTIAVLPAHAGSRRPWATVRDAACRLVLHVDAPGRLSDGLDPALEGEWAAVVLLDRLAPLLDWIADVLGRPIVTPTVAFLAQAERTPQAEIGLAIDMGGWPSTLALAVELPSDWDAWSDAFGSPDAAQALPDMEGALTDPMSDDALRPGTPIDAWLVDAHAPVEPNVLERAGSGDGLVLDPAYTGPEAGLWVASGPRWFRLARLRAEGAGRWTVREIDLSHRGRDAVAFAVELPGASASAVHVAAALGIARLAPTGLASMRVGQSIPVGLRADRRRIVLRPGTPLGTAEMLRAGRHRIARLADWMR